MFCGAEYMGAPNGKYCSRSCKYKAEMRALAEKIGELECPQCGVKFMPLTPKQRFCSKSCESRWSHANAWSEKERTCETCGAAFMSQRKDMKECPECRKKRLNLFTMESRKRKNPTVRIGIGSGGGQTWLDSDNAPVAEWGEIRSSFLQKHGHVCELCGENIERQPNVHHKDMDRKNNDETNLSVLCSGCHHEIHNLIKFLFKILEPGKDIAIDAFNLITAEVKRRKNAGNPSNGQSDLKVSGDGDQGQRLPAGEDLPSADTRPTHPEKDENIV